jgi:hypothetical protein
VLPWLVLQRFGYRQLMYYIVLKASLTAGRCVPIPPCPQAVLVTSTLRRLYLWCLKRYEEATKTLLLLLAIYALLAAPILIAC